MKHISKRLGVVLATLMLVGLFVVIFIIAGKRNSGDYSSTGDTSSAGDISSTGAISSADDISFDNAILTDEQVTQNFYNAYTRPRIEEIYATPNTEYSGTAYYVSSSEGNDGNDG